MGLDSQIPCYEIDSSEIDMEEATLIGEGSYGEVYLVKWRGTEVAAKTIRSSIASNPRVKNTFMKELALWQRLRHPNIAQFLGVLNNSDRLIFLTEYFRNGSLYDILKKKGRLDTPTAVSYALDIARCVYPSICSSALDVVTISLYCPKIFIVTHFFLYFNFECYWYMEFFVLSHLGLSFTANFLTVCNVHSYLLPNTWGANVKCVRNLIFPT